MKPLVALLAAGLLATTATAGTGTLTVEDKAGVFTPDGIAKAKGLMESADFRSPAHFVVVVGGDKDIPAGLRQELTAAVAAKDMPRSQKALAQWAEQEAIRHTEKGICLLAYKQGPVVLVRAKVDRTTDLQRDFPESDTAKLVDLFVKGLKGTDHDVWTVNVEQEYHEEHTGSGAGGTGRAAPVMG